MTKLSHLLVRKPLNLDEKAGVADEDAEVENRSDAEPIAAESATDVSARIGEACEALRNLIVEAGNKVNELEDTKQTFFQIVDPADRALRILEQEKTRNISVSRRLAQLRTSYDMLLIKFDECERRNEALIKGKQQLRLDLEEEQRSVRELRTTRAELTNDVALARAMSASLESQIADLTARTKALTDDNQRYRSHAIEAETRVSGLETELGAVRETLAILQGENQSLQSSLSQAVTESSTLAQRTREMETALTTASARIQQLDSTLFGVESDRNRLLADVNELSDRQRNDQNKLHVQFEALQARASMAEKLLGNTRQLLAARSEEARASDRQVSEGKRARDAAEVRVREIEALLRSHENQVRELERARDVLTERNTSLANSLKSREALVAEADDQKRLMTDQIARLENDAKVNRMALEKRVEELLALLDHERLERQVVEGALDATRGERAQLQHELYKLRRATRQSKPVEEVAEIAPVETPEQPNRSADAA
jgi:chromosome segregation ATPase